MLLTEDSDQPMWRSQIFKYGVAGNPDLGWLIFVYHVHMDYSRLCAHG